MSGRSFLFCNLSRPSILVRPWTPYFLYNPIKRNKGSSAEKENEGLAIDQERASSTADEFKRVAKEKEKAEEATRVAEDQGITSQTGEKTIDGAEEASGDSNIESVKNRYKKHELGANSGRTG
ncbi:hypothetical protein JCGZ_00936 [Jatropha curcas]|uniref:Uncharacterized protein n=1 Tax=Jatropha curcas TaxID=180498 RepID=A0A067L531_JATCU|nr:uncharacterized protein LOC110009362 [Jatropha curcas]XP_037494471.1 uncharacterized protein LOC110009362 [Jatropha curcas]KDP39179.1 hypothetical protein JCGZ_00936 [Jatropha curcas]